MKKVSLFAVFVTLLGLGFVSNVSAKTSYIPTGNENTINIQSNFDGGIVDPDDEDDDDEDSDSKGRPKKS